MGIHPSGRPAVYTTKAIQVHDIEFNVDIPEELFALEIPKEARVYDELTGLGWLEPGDRPELLFPEETGWGWQTWLIVGVAAAALLAAGADLLRRRRATAA